MKKFLSIIFATIILTGCTSENTVDIDYKSISTDTDIISEEHKITYEYKPITNFKNGVAWVMATSENGTPLDIKASTHEEMASTKNSTSNIKYFMINTKGEILASYSSRSDNAIVGFDGNISLIRNVINPENNQELNSIIVSNDGKELFISSIENKKEILTCDDVYYVVLAEKSNIDTKATYIEIYDKTGKAVSNKLNCTFTPGLYSSVYGNNIYAAGLGSGVFCFNDTYIKFTNNPDLNIYSTESKNFFTININDKKLTPENISTISAGNIFDNAYFNNGISVFPETFPSTGLMVYSLNGNKDKILDNYEILGGTGIYNNGMIILAGNDGDGYYHYYYNLNTKALKVLKKHAYIKMCFAYGYIIQDIRGADGKSYFAIVDENENEIIAPTEGDILISSYNSSKKYTGTEKILSYKKDNQTYLFNIDRKESINIGDIYVNDICDGIVRTETGYLNSNGEYLFNDNIIYE